MIDGEIPLTLGQRIRLLIRCLPFLFFAAAITAYLTVLATVYPFKIELVAFLALVLLVTGYQGFQALRDVTRGRALVTTDLLRNVVGRGSRSRSRYHRGEFESLGRLTLTPAAFHHAQRGQRHRVTYSPATKIVWSLEPLRD